MKKLFMKLFFALALFFSFSLAALHAQTNVSGGIYSNTTWTLANSPYIVVDTVVVFPGVKLTIDPGVEVRFEANKQIEIRQSTLVAAGTAADSITFTSNAASPGAGAYSGIYLHNSDSVSLAYCNFRYAYRALLGNTDFSFTVRHSNFTFNTYGIYFYLGAFASFDTCRFQYNTTAIFGSTRSLYRYCIFSNNQNGIKECEGASLRDCIISDNSVCGIEMAQKDSIIHCEIKNNGTGIKTHASTQTMVAYNVIENNSTGIQVNSQYDQIFCNRICSNTLYNISYTLAGNSSCIINNFWCTSDSSAVSATIEDGYDNVALGLLSYMPMDTIGCYMHIGIPAIESENHFLAIYPNPSGSWFILKHSAGKTNSLLQILNPLGETVYVEKLTGGGEHLIHPDLLQGIYFVVVSTEKTKGVGKLVIE
jgi:hypothetical protein